ncbi:hypothetical protein, partial [Streptomyces chartreusis]|uniref:hypothetical protein n=1 Tax=Streptomyces chartreusis TaxID=1969 RepID=UPI0038077EA9
MRSLLAARGLHASMTGDAVVMVELRRGGRIITTASVAGDGMRWSARAGETIVYDTPTAEPADRPAAEPDGSLTAEPAGPASEGTGVPASFNFADVDMVLVADAVACYAVEAERGTDLTGVFG